MNSLLAAWPRSSLLTVLMCAATLMPAYATDDVPFAACLERARGLARDNHYVRAADALHEILADTNEIVCAALLGTGRQGAPLRMELASLRLWWLREGRKYTSPAFAAECQAALAAFAAAAQGRNWDDYKWMYQRLAEHYQAVDDVGGVTTALYAMFAYHPLDQHSLIKLLEHLLATVHATNNLAPVIAQYYAAGGAPYPALVFFVNTRMRQEQGAAFSGLLEMLLQHPGMSLDELRAALDIIHGQLDARRPRQIDEFYNALRFCAAKQAATDERLPVIAALMSEIKKLETIFPELTAPTNNVRRVAAEVVPPEGDDATP